MVYTLKGKAPYNFIRSTCKMQPEKFTIKPLYRGIKHPENPRQRPLFSVFCTQCHVHKNKKRHLHSCKCLNLLGVPKVHPIKLYPYEF